MSDETTREVERAIADLLDATWGDMDFERYARRFAHEVDDFLDELGGLAHLDDTPRRVREASRALRRRIATKRDLGEYVGRLGAFDLALEFRRARSAPRTACERCGGSGLLSARYADRWRAVLCDCANADRMRAAGHALAGCPPLSWVLEHAQEVR